MTKRRVADLVVDMLVSAGVTDVFILTGGGSMHLNDAFGRNPRLNKIFCHHEQASAMAAESYARVSGKLAALNVTTGPGGINALNGVYGAYTDSIGMVVISGQVKRETFAPNYPVPLRQLGDQEVDIVSIVRPITKYATVLQDPLKTRCVIERAIWLATHGRPGPTWVDIPIDVQGSKVSWDELEPFNPADELRGEDFSPNTIGESDLLSGAPLSSIVTETIQSIKDAERPIIFAGAGVRISRSHDAFMQLIEALQVPVVSGWNAHDVLPNAHPQYAGRPGTLGDRPGNFAVQNSDLVLVLGSRLNIRQISYNWKSFAPNAKIIMVDVDLAELRKPTLRLHAEVHADLRDFLDEANAQLSRGYSPIPSHLEYLQWCRNRVAQYSVVVSSYWDKPSPINPYCFVDRLFDQLDEGDIVVTGNGTACVVAFQAAKIKKGQRLYTNSGSASMGYDLPAAVGAWYASKAKRIICLAGDGSIMMNIQELQTITSNSLPIKIFVLNNDGYQSIRLSQKHHFPDNPVGYDSSSGVMLPNFSKLASAFEIGSSIVGTHADLDLAIRAALDSKGPHLCEVLIDASQPFSPKLESRLQSDGSMVPGSFEDMTPFLPKEELAANTKWAHKARNDE